jgi:hypothetical protein
VNLERWNGALDGVLYWSAGGHDENYSLEVLPCQGCLNKRYDVQDAICSTNLVELTKKFLAEDEVSAPKGLVTT